MYNNNNNDKPFKKPRVDLVAERIKREKEEERKRREREDEKSISEQPQEQPQEQPMIEKEVFDFSEFIKRENSNDEKNQAVPFHLIIENEHNIYPITEIKEMEDSILQYGLLQPLALKKITDELGQYKYIINSGHRRYQAIKNLIDKGYEKFRQVPYVVITADNEIEERLKLHETNLQSRPLLKMKEEEKLSIVEDYLDLIKQAREQGVKIGGKEVKGKTRDILAQQFNISDYTAQKLITTIKKSEGGEISPPAKSPKNKGLTLKKMIKSVETIDKGLDEEETKLVQELIEKLQELI